MSVPRPRRHRRGLTLIEAIAAVTIVAVATPPMFWAIRDAQTSRTRPIMALRARWLAAERLEDVLADARSASRGYAYVTAANYPAENGVAGYPGLRRSVSVTESGPGPIQAGAGLKLVTVTVTYPDARSGQGSFSVSTVVADLGS